MEPLLSQDYFSLYRRFRERNAADRDYTEPFIPVVPERYGTNGLAKFVYCGAAIWESEQVDYSDDVRAYSKSLAFTQEHMKRVGCGECANTAFWRFFDAASKVVLPELSLQQRAECSVWTNLSKIGEASRAFPRDANGELVALDVAQAVREFATLSPDWLLCVSGAGLVDTGNRAFGMLPRIDDFELRTKDTVLKRLPRGGVLIWTMHPNRKSPDWTAGLLDDLRKIVIELTHD